MSKLRDFLDMMSCCDLSKREIIEHFGITACCAAWKQKKHLIMKETSADKPSHQAASKPLYLKKKKHNVGWEHYTWLQPPGSLLGL